ncbi:MAG: transposase [Acidobacteria bacterium]|nr:transposase [Acidobacteriota bacterium]
MSDGDRRVDAGVFGEMWRAASLGPCHRSLHAAGPCARGAALPPLVRRARVRGAGRPPLAAQAQAESAFIDPGKLWQNGAGESFHGKLRDEYLTLQCASTGSETRLRLHSSLEQR